MIVRSATPVDAVAMSVLMNEIIAIGGTTAHQHPMSPEAIGLGYIDGPTVKSAVVADDQGRVIGFQVLDHWQERIHIGTFVQAGLQARGVGASMFQQTCAAARASGIAAIIAWIRADNVPGLAFYARMGFRDIGSDPDFALEDGRVVGRIYRQFDL